MGGLGWLRIFHGSSSGTTERVLEQGRRKCPWTHCRGHSLGLVSNVTSAERPYLPGSLLWIIFLYLCISEINHLNLSYLLSISQLRWKLHEGRDFICLVFVWIESLAYGRCSINTIDSLVTWMNEWTDKMVGDGGEPLSGISPAFGRIPIWSQSWS